MGTTEVESILYVYVCVAWQMTGDRLDIFTCMEYILNVCM